MNTPQFKPSVIEKIEAELDAILRNQVEAQVAMGFYSWDKVLGLNPKKGQPSKKELRPWLYKFAIEQNLDDPDVKEGLANAVANRKATPDEYNDFKRIADKSPEDLTNEKVMEMMTKIEILLLVNWRHPSQDWKRCLCFYTDNALSKMIDGLSDVKVRLPRDTVAKTYKRMNLKKASILLFKDVEIKGDTAIPIPYQKLLV
jgi:hypothetical protein|tara:strand:- start:850 stop:1452 length:603 start_codon:yes stop_codon:yes gene_type:complete